MEAVDDTRQATLHIGNRVTLDIEFGRQNIAHGAKPDIMRKIPPALAPPLLVTLHRLLRIAARHRD